MNSDHNKMLDEYIAFVNSYIDDYINDYYIDDDYKILIDAIRYSLENGGKRIRPVLAFEFCRLCGGDYEDALPFACAIEMVHTYSLIHDDLPCMDDDDMRRGKPSCHKKFGEEYALLAGDALLTMAFEVVSTAQLPDSVKIKAVEIISHSSGAKGMIAGQVIDLLCENKDVDVSMLEKIDFHKTVGLLKAACLLGCITANCSSEQYEIACVYAENMGLAFQIKDDILDVIGDEKILGKPVGSDKEKEKSTYVSQLGIETSQQIIEKLSKDANKALDPFGPEASFLKEFTKALINRQK